MINYQNAPDFLRLLYLVPFPTHLKLAFSNGTLRSFQEPVKASHLMRCTSNSSCFLQQPCNSFSHFLCLIRIPLPGIVQKLACCISLLSKDCLINLPSFRDLRVLQCPYYRFSWSAIQVTSLQQPNRIVQAISEKKDEKYCIGFVQWLLYSSLMYYFFID